MVNNMKRPLMLISKVILKKIKKDINLIESGNSNSIDSSVPFIGSMLTAVWKFNGVDRKIDLKAINSTGK